MKPYYEQDGITIYHGDCREILPHLDPVDLVLTDPPYGIAYDRNKKHKGTVKDARVVGDDKPFDPSFMLKYQRLILWGGNCYASRLPDSKTWLSWRKTLTDNKKGQTSDCELAWANCIGRSRHFEYLWSGAYRADECKDYFHPTQKPIALMRWCINLVKPRPQSIIDPFMGSGSTLVAAKLEGVRAIGIEIEERYCEIAVNRLRQGVLPFDR